MIPQILKMSIVKSVSKLIRFNSNLSVNGHGFLVRLEGKVIKNASDYSPGVETRTKNTYIRSTSGNNELLLKLQAVEEERTRNKHRAANTFYKMSVASDATSISRIPTLYAQNDHGTIKIIDVKKEFVNMQNQNNPLQFQLIGERSIMRMAESEVKEHLLENLKTAKLMDEKFANTNEISRAYRIRSMTGWEKTSDGRRKVEIRNRRQHVAD